MMNNCFLKFKHLFFVFFLFAVTKPHAQIKNNQQRFLAELDTIRTSLKIPGMAVGLAIGDSVIFETGLGYADIKNSIKVTPTTSFRIASITKTFASTIIMQLVEKGKLNLETPVSQFGIDLGNPGITVKNLLTHTSEGEPGTYFQYNGYRYGKLGIVIEKAAGIPFFQLLMENIVKPLNLSTTAPGISLFSYFTYTRQQKEMLPFFENAFTHLAKPYEINSRGEIVETQYLDEFGTFGGLTSTMPDLLKYSAAIDRHQFVKPITQQLIYSPNRTKDGVATPYGLGWFTQQYRGIDFYWHYGQTQGESGLFVKVPSKKLTLVVLANIDKLSAPFPLSDGDLLTSPAGQLFYKYFINTDSQLAIIDYSLPVPAIRKALMQSDTASFKNFYNKEIITQATISNSKGDTAKAKDFYQLYADLNASSNKTFPKAPVIAAIDRVGINQEPSLSFTLTKETKVRVYGVGENCSGDFKFWCDYGWIEDKTGAVVWQMQGQPAKPAGGAQKNKLVDTTIMLAAGSYKLRYKSDGGHAYNNWDSLPPDDFYWGITLFKE